MPWTHSKTKETPSRLRDVRVVFSHYGCADSVTVSTTLHLHAIDATRVDFRRSYVLVRPQPLAEQGRYLDVRRVALALAQH